MIGNSMISKGNFRTNISASRRCSVAILSVSDRKWGTSAWLGTVSTVFLLIPCALSKFSSWVRFPRGSNLTAICGASEKASMCRFSDVHLPYYLYLLRWQPHVDSLKIFDVVTHGFFSTVEEPNRVVALVSYPLGADPDEVIKAYMQSEGFHEDMAGVDMRQMERVETLSLIPGQNSPLP